MSELLESVKRLFKGEQRGSDKATTSPQQDPSPLPDEVVTPVELPLPDRIDQVVAELEEAKRKAHDLTLPEHERNLYRAHYTALMNKLAGLLVRLQK